jgi:TRAP-type C4-dicarboxylate transport system permease small subunit
MQSFWKAIEWITDKLRILGAACLVGMTFLTCADVVGRFFRHPIFGSVEIVSTLATLAVAMALPYTHRVGGHIGVEILVMRLSEKKQTVIDFCTSILSLVLFAIVTWRMTVYARHMGESGEVSMNLELPTHAWIYITAFCFAVFTLIILRQVIETVRKLRNL